MGLSFPNYQQTRSSYLERVALFGSVGFCPVFSYIIKFPIMSQVDAKAQYLMPASSKKPLNFIFARRYIVSSHLGPQGNAFSYSSHGKIILFLFAS
jgi:hypothetical protein